jgi:hypothetical protein
MLRAYPRIRDDRLEEALVDYRTALQSAAEAATNEEERSLYQIHKNSLLMIERHYHNTRDAAQCRPLILEEQTLHEIDDARGYRFSGAVTLVALPLGRIASTLRG